MSLLEKEYYTIEESLQKLRKIEPDFKEEDLHYYGENNQLEFCVYVNSRPSFAAAVNPQNGEYYYIGYCFITALCKIDVKTLCSIFANRKAATRTELLFCDGFVKPPIPSNWSETMPQDVANAGFGEVTEKWKPEAYKKDLPIIAYYLIPRCMLQINDTGELVPYELLTKSMLDDNKKFSLGTSKCTYENQLFMKSDLRITHCELEKFISLIKNTPIADTMSEGGGYDDCRPVDISKQYAIERGRKGGRRPKHCQALQTFVDQYRAGGKRQSDLLEELSDFTFESYPTKDIELFPTNFPTTCDDMFILKGKVQHKDKKKRQDRLHYTADEGEHKSISINTLKNYFCRAKGTIG